MDKLHKRLDNAELRLKKAYNIDCFTISEEKRKQRSVEIWSTRVDNINTLIKQKTDGIKI